MIVDGKKIQMTVSVSAKMCADLEAFAEKNGFKKAEEALLKVAELYLKKPEAAEQKAA